MFLIFQAIRESIYIGSVITALFEYSMKGVVLECILSHFMYHKFDKLQRKL